VHAFNDVDKSAEVINIASLMKLLVLLARTTNYNYFLRFFYGVKQNLTLRSSLN